MAVVLCLLTLAYWVCGLYSALGASPVLELRQIIQINTIGFLAAAIGGVSGASAAMVVHGGVGPVSRCRPFLPGNGSPLVLQDVMVGTPDAGYQLR